MGGDINDVCLLEGVCSQQVGEDLTCDAYQGCAVDHGVCQAGDQVSSARAAGSEYDACFAGSAGIALCCVYATLFVADEDML